MNRTLLVLIMVVAASLCGAATDRFYISDFSIAPGQTRQVSIMLDNEIEYTAFQADLFMTEGLEVTQVNGAYNIALTDRKGSDHVLTTALREDGSIRMMSYSLGVKPFSGNSGALVNFEVAAAADFVGPAFVVLSNICFTTTMGEEVIFDDSFSIVQSRLRGDVNDDKAVTIADVTKLIDHLLDETVVINRVNADMNEDGAITINDVTSLIDLLLGN